MVSIRGNYEYDDDDLTPGNKKEGGLHQNLFDSGGNLKGSARFVPDDPNEDRDELSVIYIETTPPVKSKEQEAIEQAIQEQISKLIDYGIARAKPHVQRFLQERVRPAIQSKWENRPRPRRTKRQLPSGEPSAVATWAVLLSEEVKDATAAYRHDTTSFKAQARLLMAMFLRTLSDEQLDQIAEDMLDEGYAELEHRLAEVSPQQGVLMIESVEANPSLLVNQLLNFERFLGLTPTDGERQPIEDRKDQ